TCSQDCDAHRPPFPVEHFAIPFLFLLRCHESQRLKAGVGIRFWSAADRNRLPTPFRSRIIPRGRSVAKTLQSVSAGLRGTVYLYAAKGVGSRFQSATCAGRTSDPRSRADWKRLPTPLGFTWPGGRLRPIRSPARSSGETADSPGGRANQASNRRV